MFPPTSMTEDSYSCCASGKDLSREDGRRDSKDVVLEEGEGVLLENGGERFSRKIGVGEVVGESAAGMVPPIGREINATGVLYGTFRTTVLYKPAMAYSPVTKL